MTLIDIGANLTHESFRTDLDAVLDRADAQHVNVLVVTGASHDGSRDALELARRYPGRLYATCGNHPHHAAEFTPEIARDFSLWSQAPEVKAVGETGLDYFRDLAPRSDQRDTFEAQLEVAEAVGKPVFLHQRDAHDDFIAILRAWRDRLTRAVVHCFTDTQAALHDYLDLDLHVGITGWICDERRGHHLRDFVQDIPAGRLMIETDSPYLLPRDLRPRPKSRRNEPMYLRHIAQTLAECRGEPLEDLAAHTTATARAFFEI